MARPTGTRQDRLLRATIACVSERGYRGTTVKQICERAGVSRTAFYARFPGRREAYLAALDAILAALEQETFDIAGLLERVAGDPDTACALLVESHACQPDALRRRARAGELVAARCGGDAVAAALAGVVISRVPYDRAGELPGLAAGLEAWGRAASRVALAPSGTRRRSRRRGQAPGSLIGPEVRRLRPGPGQARDHVAEVQREALLDAVALVVARDGLDALTVGALVGQARVSRRTFYEQFESAEAAFVAALELGGDAMLDLTQAAYAAADDRPAGVTAALQALCGFLSEEPAFARICLVDSLGAGRAALEVRESIQARLRELLSEAYAAAAGGRDGGSVELAAEASAGAIIELCAERLRRERPDELPALAPSLGELALAGGAGAAAESRARS